jgi:hypothetical protein
MIYYYTNTSGCSRFVQHQGVLNPIKVINSFNPSKFFVFLPGWMTQLSTMTPFQKATWSFISCAALEGWG